MYAQSMRYDSSFKQWDTPLYTQSNSKLKPKEIMLYKTEACRNWTELGSCRYGKKCRYAHGETELRSVQRHTRYKTQICRAYHTDGSCPYGIRCTFIHESDGVIENNSETKAKKKNNKKNEFEATAASSTAASSAASPIVRKPTSATITSNTSTTAEPLSLIWRSMLGLATRRGSLESSQGSETGSEESISLDFPSMMVPSSNSSRPDYLSTFMMKQQPIETMQHHFSQNRSIWM